MAGELLKATYDNTQSSNWIRYRTSELIAEGKLTIGDGYRAKNSELCPLKSGLVFARAGNINQGFKFDNADYLAGENLRRVGEKISEEGDVLFTSKGTVGRVAFVCDKTSRFVYSPQLSWWRIRDKSLIEPRFLYYWMLGREFSLQINSFKGQTDMADCVSLKDQRQMYITLPPLPEQKAIARILSSLDDKIELNQQMNGTLEAIAQAIFKSWFVDFDPVRAKMDGRQPAGMDAATADLFPDSFENSPLGMIPKGWRACRWGDIATLEYGKSLRGYQDANGLYRVYGTNGPIGWHTEALFKHPGVIIGRKGAYRGVHYSPHPFFVIDTAFYLKQKVDFNMKWAYYELLSFDINSLDSGSAIPSTSREDFYSIPVCLPSVEVLRAFDEILKPLFEKCETNDKESEVIASIRDSLLPKLLSGELRVKEAEKIMEVMA